MKRLPNHRLSDTFHRGFVIGCLGLTAYGTLLLGMRVYQYFTVSKPAAELRALQMIRDKNNERTENSSQM